MDRRRWLCDICGTETATRGSLQRHCGRRHQLNVRSVTERVIVMTREVVRVTASAASEERSERPTVTAEVKSEVGHGGSARPVEEPPTVIPRHPVRIPDAHTAGGTASYEIAGGVDPFWPPPVQIEEADFPFQPDETLVDLMNWTEAVRPNLPDERVDEEAIANVVFASRSLQFPLEWEEFCRHIWAQWPMTSEAVLRGVFRGFMRRTMGTEDPFLLAPLFLDDF